MPRAVRPQLVSSFYADMDFSESSENASELEDSNIARNIENGTKDDSYVNELEQRKKYVQEFIDKSFHHFKKGLDFSYIHDQDMNYYQETYAYSDNYDKPMLGPSDDDSHDVASNDGPDYDPDYDEEVNRLLDEVAEDILQENSNPPTEKDPTDKNGHDDPKREQYDDCFDEFPDDMHHVGPIPSWYQEMLEKKMKETRSRLGNLSSLCCFACATTGAHIKRMEQDHSTVFCKMEFPRHPPLDKPWTNFWKFNCMITCKEIDKPNHAHTADCESVLLQHANTGVTTMTQNVSRNDYPKFVMDAVELFQDFAIETTKNVPFLDSKEAPDTVYEKPTWTEMKLRSNYKNELMIIVRGKGVTSLITKLRRYFDSGPGRTSNVISVFCINQKWSQKKSNFLPSYVTGFFTLRDKVGPISINYDTKTNMAFNSVEAIQLGKVIQDYADLTDQTTLLDIGCNFGVLSLMLSHKCDRVFGLNTMNSVSSEISQAEELKKFNNIHNVSFMGCDTKDVLTKCQTALKRCMTVAVLNLASPYGKSIHVMQALRDLPTVWKVIVYGSFTKEYHRNISMLTCKDEFMGEHFLPMQYCILDKSPSAENAFDIVILFERKSLMAPIVNPLASGPTLNIKPNSVIDEYGTLDTHEVMPILKVEKGFGKPDFRSKKFGSKPFNKFRGPLNKFGKFDSPMLPMDKEQPEKPKEKSKERSPSPTTTERKFDCSVLRQKPPPPLPPPAPAPAAAATTAKKVLDRPVYPSIRKELQFKDLKRIYDSPSLPMPKEEKPFAASRARSPSASAKARSFDCSVLKKDKQFDCSVLKKEKPFDCSVLRNQEKLLQQSRDKQQSPLPHPFLSVKKEFQYSCPTPPRERYPSPPPPPPTDTPPTGGFSMLDSSKIKKEKDFVDAPVAAVKTEPMQLYEDKEEGELSPEECDRFPNVPIKSQQIDPSYFVGFSEVSPKQMTVKPEPADTFQGVGIKNEPEDMLVSPISDDIENMVTPIHNPRALDANSAPLVASTNVKTTLDGFEFSVRANQSFLSSKCDPSEQAYAGARVKKEFADKELADTDEEIKIIDEKRVVSGQPRKLQSKDSEPRIRVKSLDEIIKEKSEMEQNDLRTLIEQRKTLQRKLDRQKEVQYYKEFHGRSPTPDLPRKYRQQPSPSPPPSFRKYRSPSPRERKYVRSPSPYSSRHRSPVSRKYRKSPPSPARWIKRERSPASPARWAKRERSPASPVRWIKRDRSPSIGRTRRSPSPNERRRKRSPPSPNGRHRRRSPPSPIRSKREPYSPPRFKREPVSPASSKWSERSRRSPSSSPSHKRDYGVSKSPVRSRRDNRKRRSRSRSPVEIKRKRHSFSPVTLSPSPPRKQRNDSQERDTLKKKKKKSKLKSKSKSRSPSRTLKKKNKTASSASGNATTAQDESHWDIPGLSALPSPVKNSSQHGKKSNVEATSDSVRIDETKKVKRERASRSRSITPISWVEDIVKTEVCD